MERVSPIAIPGPTAPIGGRAPVVRLLCDRFLPASLFAVAAGIRGFGLLTVVRRGPTGTRVEAWPVYLLELSHHTLAFFFFGFIATLFLARRAPRGNRAGPLALATALAGSFVTNVSIFQPSTTRDWQVLALADLLTAAGLAFTIYAAASLRYCFGLAPEARGLVTTGAYRLVRHPLYLGEFVAMFGAMLPLLAPLTVSVFALFSVLQATRMVLEERVLAASFPEYAAYRLRTPMILPWPRPSRPLKLS